MKITLDQYRTAVTNWLRAEKATINHAMALQFSLLGGVIDGGQYLGDRAYSYEAAGEYETQRPNNIPSPEYDDEDTDESDCGCLLDTMERVFGLHKAKINGDTEVTFIGAMNIWYGDTPSTNPWAKAAYDGASDYIAVLSR